MKYLYDTNIFIYYLAGDETVSELFSDAFLNNNYVVISPIIRIELLCFSGLSDDETEVIENLLSQFDSIAISRKVENQTIALKRKHKIKLPDAIIAATALCQEAVVITRNVHDFQCITELKLENPFDDE
ncbi:type II toxin-antitoxin system VapC family toxin [Calothrix sp. PCC 7507]|uniref:type II toxin-antitoxin system VapC family toxin n=1 Tax=Calothrix sp. PCC 7507 TaxID=99598 RepID=UPI00029F2C4B|nr:type II toxin-antitoxin system VapC family toxin [Calothrix sp. PCC 7507]AFY35552.1 PilT protein domain protein [Calothrix sp. PCC 7507]